jgi:hypothetical protein
VVVQEGVKSFSSFMYGGFCVVDNRSYGDARFV